MMLSFLRLEVPPPLSAQLEPVHILLAEDDEQDRFLIRKALQKSRILAVLDCVEDGEELLDFLYRRGAYAHLQGQPLPGLVLMDLNMPRKDGREALGEIRACETLRHLPIIVLTTSRDEADVYRSYNLGANSYITKPVTFEGLVAVMGCLGNYWFQIVRLPGSPDVPQAREGKEGRA